MGLALDVFHSNTNHHVGRQDGNKYQHEDPHNEDHVLVSDVVCVRTVLFEQDHVPEL